MKITDRIHLLKIDFDITINQTQKIPRFVNVLIVFGDKITLVDTGVKGSESKIFDYIHSQGRDFNEIETIILSHAHPDHIGSAAKIKELTNCKILAHHKEQEWIEQIEIQNEARPVPGFFELVDTAPNVDILLSNYQDLVLNKGLSLRIIKASGHSKGMLTILFIEDRVLFTADAIPLEGDIPNYYNFNELMRSLIAIKNSREYEILLTSWTPPLTKIEDMQRVLTEGESYLKKVDKLVRKYYLQSSGNTLECCRQVIEKLALPPFLANSVIDKAFQSHLL